MRCTRFFSAMIVLCCILLSGCAKQAKSIRTPSELTGLFNAKIEITYNDLTSVMTLKKQAEKNYEAVIESPPLLKDMKIHFSDDIITIDYRGLAGSYKPEDLPGAAAVKLLVGALDAVASTPDLAFSEQDETTLICDTLTIADQKALITYDNKTNRPVKIEIPDLGFTAVFQTFELN